jgi:hypothetical protein
MTSTNVSSGPGWVPDVCTLPTVEQPLRLAEFDALFANVTVVDRNGTTQATLTLAGESGLRMRAQELADRETTCCSFFSFDIIALAPGRPDTSTNCDASEKFQMSIRVPEQHAAMLKAIVDRAEQVSR